MLNRNIAVIDDETAFLHILAEYGRLQGVVVDCYASWSDEVQSQVNHSEILFLDMQMPGNDGLDVLTDLSNSCYDGAIVLVSGVDEVMLDYALEFASSKGLKPVGYLQKPFLMDDFANALKKCGQKEASEPETPVLFNFEELSVEELRRAISEKWFYPIFQPQINVDTCKVVGIECLARLEHPTLGNIPPLRFIPTLEDNLLINKFTEVIIKASLSQLSDVLRNFADLTVSFNISSRTLNQQMTIKLIDIFNASSVRPEQIVLEVTETSAIDVSQETEFALTKLRLFGVGLSIDDFGTGYSTISQINKLPFNELKIDSSFVQHLTEKQTSRAIVASTCQLAESLNYRLVAEGVENEEQLAFLKKHNSTIIQGFYYEKPLTLVQLQQFVESFDGAD